MGIMSSTLQAKEGEFLYNWVPFLTPRLNVGVSYTDKLQTGFRIEKIFDKESPRLSGDRAYVKGSTSPQTASLRDFFW